VDGESRKSAEENDVTSVERGQSELDRLGCG